MGELQKSLSFPVILLITINSIMGTGIFFLPALGAHESGPMSILAWVAIAIVAMLMSLVFAELCSMFPTAGGVYEYCKQAFGSFPSFLVGWVTLIVGNVTIAMLVVGAVRYLNPELSILFSIGFSLMFIAMFNYMAFRGLQTSAVMLVAFAIITLISVLGLAIPGIWHFDTNNLIPFNTHGISAVLLTIFLVAETFFGWETATFLAEETKNAHKVIPKALIVGTAVIAVIVLLFVIVSLGVLPWQELGRSATPLADIAAVIYGSQAKVIFAVLVYVSIIGSVAGWIVSAPRLLMALAKDKMFVEQLSEIHPTYKTPHKAILFQTILTSLLVIVGSGSYEELLHLLVPLVLLLYAAVVIALIVMRHTKPDIVRHFKMPFGVPTSIMLVVFLLGLIAFWMLHDPHAWSTVKFGSSLIVLGVPVYILLKYTYDPQAVISSQKAQGWLYRLLEFFLLPMSVRKYVLKDIDLEDKKVLELGGNVGTMSLQLAPRIGLDGHLTVTEVSSTNARMIQKRISNAGFENVNVIFDEHEFNRIHPSVTEIDIVFSFGFLSYIQDLPKVLKDICDAMPKNGKIVFVEYADYFKVLPNTGWIANSKKLRTTFEQAGFSVKIEKKTGMLWNYIIIEGIRTDHIVPYI